MQKEGFVLLWQFKRKINYTFKGRDGIFIQSYY